MFSSNEVRCEALTVMAGVTLIVGFWEAALDVIKIKWRMFKA
jgi:hypothetical protein